MKKNVLPIFLSSMLLAGSLNVSAKVTLNYWEKWTGFEGDIIKQLVDKFNKKQNKITVKLTLGWTVEEKFLTACAAGNPPDIVGLWNHRLAPYVDAGLVQPLDQYFKLMNISKKDFVPAYWDMMNFKGKMYGAPITPSAFTFYWNKGAFADAGLNPEVPPKTMEEIMFYNDKLTKRDSAGKLKQIGYSPAHPGWWPYLWPVFFGGDLFNEDKNSIDLLSAPIVKGYDWVSTMSKKLGLQNLSKLNMGDYRSKQGPFFSGKMAMDIQGSWQPSFLLKYAPHIKYGVTGLPFGQGGSEWAWLESDVIFLPKAGKRNKEAAEFIRYMMSPEVQREFQIKRETFSAIKAVNTKEFQKTNNNPNIEELVDIATSKLGRYAPKTTIWADLDSKVYNPVFWDVWNQKKSPTQALTSMQKLANDLVNRKLKKKK